MTSRNDITGDAIQTKGWSEAFSEGWDLIFGRTCPTCSRPKARAIADLSVETCPKLVVTVDWTNAQAFFQDRPDGSLRPVIIDDFEHNWNQRSITVSGKQVTYVADERVSVVWERADPGRVNVLGVALGLLKTPKQVEKATLK